MAKIQYCFTAAARTSSGPLRPRPFHIGPPLPFRLSRRQVLLQSCDKDVWGNRADFWIAAHALVSPQALHVERRTNTRKHARTLAPGGARLHTPGSGRRAALRSYSYLSSVRARSRTPALRRSRSFHGSLCPVLGLGRGSGVQWPARGVAGPLPPPQLPLLIALSVPDQTEGYYTVGRQ
jgi:hypothetical protein